MYAYNSRKHQRRRCLYMTHKPARDRLVCVVHVCLNVFVGAGKLNNLNGIQLESIFENTNTLFLKKMFSFSEFNFLGLAFRRR